MALVQKTNKVSFGRGPKSLYNAAQNPGLIYFATDESAIYVGGVAYGLSSADLAKLNNSVNGISLSGNTLTVTYTSGKAATTINLLASNVKMADGTTVEAAVKANATAISNEVARATAAEEANANKIATLNGADTVAGSVANKIKTAIAGLDVNAIGGTGKVITTVSEQDGKISATAIDLTAGAVAATASKGDNSHVAVEGATVAAQIESLAKSVKSVSVSAKSYSVSAISGEELSALGTNVKEAFKLVDEKGNQAGETIKIYKDSSLKSVALDGQTLNFTYILANGSESTVGVDVSTFLAESEFKNGLEVVDHVVNVKVDTASEKFLTVGEDGVKLSGIQTAIDKAAKKATTEVAEDATGHVTVTKTTGSNGQAVYTIGENDIASNTALTAEVNRAKAAEDKIEASVGLAADGSHVAASGNYTSGATTIAGEISALDTQVKKNADAIATLNGSGDGSVAKAVSDAKTDLLGGATTDYNTLGKLESKIKTAVSEASAAHTVVNAKTDGHVQVTVSKSADSTHDVVTITENNIASADALTAEVAARKAVSGQKGATYSANSTANYINTAASLNDADVKLDAAVKNVENMLLWYESDNAQSQA